MARIRSIKPEFPQSESMGNVSRDARLLFVLLWTICDDSGRARGDSRFLARTLYPYDDGRDGAVDTSSSHVEAWLAELEREQCLVRYEAGGSTYLQITNWLNHQKIDKPSASKIPEFAESSRILANPPRRKGSGPGSGKDQEGKGSGEERNEASPPVAADATTDPPPAGVDPLSATRTDPPPDQIVFDHWRTAMRHPQAKFDDQRRKLIRRAIKLGYTAPDLCAAIDGCRASDWHMGANDRHTVYDGLGLILRDADHIDKFRALATARQTPQLNEAGRATAQAAQRWLSSHPDEPEETQTMEAADAAR